MELSINLSIYLYISLNVELSIYLYLSLYLPEREALYNYISIYLSIYLSITIYVHIYLTVRGALSIAVDGVDVEGLGTLVDGQGDVEHLVLLQGRGSLDR